MTPFIDQKEDTTSESQSTGSIIPTKATFGESTSGTWSGQLPLRSHRGVSTPERVGQVHPPVETTSNDKESTETGEELPNAKAEYPPSNKSSLNYHSEIDDIPEKTDELVAKFDEQMARLEISFVLTQAILHLVGSKDVEAEDCAQKSLDLAKELGEEAAIARSFYWLGIIELYRGKDAKAHRSLLNARPCIGKYDEGNYVPLVLSFFQRGVTNADRQRIVQSQGWLTRTKDTGSRIESEMSAPCPSVLNRISTSQSQPLETDKPGQGTKRKLGGLDMNDQALRPPYNARGEKTKSKLWPVRDRGDIYSHAGDGTNPNYDILCWEGPFTFTMYPKGLAPRFRPTDIIPKQHYEWIMSKSEWMTVRENWKEKSVTMSFLAYERKEIRRCIRQKSLENDLGSRTIA
ncbi:hypothetical protein PHISCL_03351 [Aspergillus sclerotialis]|uniref:Uncharacterized protein n=1 Tax=Aspergillus sclerotialis TaxID=2070753 RepID=A0A3A2ZMQ9_9EURO|nr:hypothetical protein PHISCL_03351 [Aspergillus sclerotialis]